MKDKKSYKCKYEKLLRDLHQAIEEGTVLTHEFRERVQKEKKQLDGDSKTTYPAAGPDVIII